MAPLDAVQINAGDPTTEPPLAGDVSTGTGGGAARLKFQPRSSMNIAVKSLGGVTSWDSWPEIAGAINWSGNAIKSMCETEEPSWKGLGVYIKTRLLASAPCRMARLTPRVAETGPDASAPLRVTPSACEILTAGIKMVESVPPNGSGGLPATLLAIRTPTAPAFCAFSTLTVKLHVPRSMRAIFPLTAAALAPESALHTRLGLELISKACTTWAVTPGLESAGPKSAGPTL